MIRRTICCVFVILIPVWAAAEDAGAMLESKGVVLVNGNQTVGLSSAIFSGALIETKDASGADITAPGTSVIVLPDSLVEFQGQIFSLEHGSISVLTSNGTAVRVHCLTIIPASMAWTRFEVMDVNGSIKIAARKNDVRVETIAPSKKPKGVSASQGGNLREGEETTRYESDGCETMKTKKDTGAEPTATGGILSSEYAKWFALAAIGGTGLFVAVRGDNPASAAIP
jgi:hypothetical protein